MRLSAVIQHRLLFTLILLIGTFLYSCGDNIFSKQPTFGNNTDVAIADFTYSQLSPKTFTFTNMSEVTGVNAIGCQYIWDFADGTPEIYKTDKTLFTHEFPKYNETYTVTLRVQKRSTTLSAKTFTVTTSSAPSWTGSVDFTYSPTTITKGSAATFTNTTTPHISGLTYSWNFGDGAILPIDSNDPVTHSFSTTGNHTVILIALENGNVVGSRDKNITINAYHEVSPDFSFSQNTSSGKSFTFTNNTLVTGIDELKLSYFWSFGDGSDSVKKTDKSGITHDFPDYSAEYSVTLSVEDGAKELGSVTKTVTTGIAPGGATPSWQALTKGEHNITETNTGFDVVVVHAPASKPESKYPLIEPLRSAIEVTSSGTVLPSLNPPTDLMESGELYDDGFNEYLRKMELEIIASEETLYDSSRDVSKAIGIKTYVVGNNYTFNDSKSGGTYTARCVGESDNTYYFAETSAIGNVTALLPDYKVGFEKIYTTVTSKFGPTGDVDENGKVLIVFHPMTGVMLGYFYPADKRGKSVTNAFTNEADVFYINSNIVDTNPMTKEKSLDLVFETLSHELQHMTFFNNKLVKKPGSSEIDDTWLTEALSMLSSFLTGYGVAGSNNDNWIKSFLKTDHPNTSLTSWTSKNYGYGAIFSYYLLDRFGGDIASKIYDSYSSNVGLAAVEKATSTDFNVLFTDFAQALYLSNTGVSADPKFNFKSINMKDFISSGSRPGLAYGDSSVNAGASETLNILPYSLSLIKINGDVRKINVQNLDDFYPYGAILK